MKDEGVLAEFDDVGAFRAAVAALLDDGYRSLEVFTPYPVSPTVDRLHPRPWTVTHIAGLGAIFGVTAAYLLQWYLNARLYPLNVGSRALHSVPAFFPITFEMGVLFTALSVFVTALLLSGMPRLWRPIFEVEGIERATVDRFFVLVRSDDPRFEWGRVRDRLHRLQPLRVVESRSRA